MGRDVVGRLHLPFGALRWERDAFKSGMGREVFGKLHLPFGALRWNGMCLGAGWGVKWSLGIKIVGKQLKGQIDW